MNEFLQKKWEAADLTDDYIFNKVMLDYDICLEVLRRILPDLHIKKIDLPNNQQEIALAPDAKAVRFDIYTTDEQGNHYDIEMQVADHHNIAKRIRYYQTVSSMEAYDKGQPYEKADDSYVIFFCNFDPFQLGEQRYILHKHIDGVPEYVVKDGQTDILFNVPSLKHDVNPKMQAFLDMIAQRKVEESDPLVVKLRKRMAVVKRNRKWRSEYMQRSVYEMDQEMREQRIKEDEEQIKKDQEQIKKEKQELKEANQRLVEGNQKLVEGNQRLLNNRNAVIKSLICTLRNLDLDNHLIKKEIKKNFDLKDEEIDKYLK
ncbi:Rpn family recombination-promoting nuclease/putative transposase [Limosilactobacillus reuteri]|uniref:Rpn family recombination-promoting nuclease/putative transposase n=1 Tax=Limosilactobacillus reuteri TaxID=1598 RepID=UPI001C12281D|nr:Rpn family recombination-promoting nuclease/putative transposase [Limosilactobacillus reuteri]MBU5284230.1 Rpn family recombination-promoting nuclease/putative transposase [Limosilactobacillus reuteri]MCC4396081.1 Rpn family recombination-promoting nuclease/putative transposase [Limosilactobacillus reuteri]MCC4401704.1 Rpn family recombination-promoting nuclease/putative transposase [Limosilactobacillus reuteri]